jgi:hypothetical protein
VNVMRRRSFSGDMSFEAIHSLNSGAVQMTAPDAQPVRMLTLTVQQYDGLCMEFVCVDGEVESDSGVYVSALNSSFAAANGIPVRWGTKVNIMPCPQ